MVAVDEHSNLFPCALWLVLWPECLDPSDHSSAVLAHPVRFMAGEQPVQPGADRKKSDGAEGIDHGGGEHTFSVAEIRPEVGYLVWESIDRRQTGRVATIAVNVLSSVLTVGHSNFIANLDTTRVTDSGSTSTVVIVAGVLVIVAFVLIGFTIWFWRNTVPDPDALESLVFFEERVVDSAPDPRDEHLRRPKRGADDDRNHERRHVRRKERVDRDPALDRTEGVPPAEVEKHRRFRGR